MPIPFLFIGIAALTGAIGTGKITKAAINNSKAKKINNIANEDVRVRTEKLEQQREYVSSSLENLGKLKINILNDNVNRFINDFEQLKNVDLQDSLGLEELKNLHLDKKNFAELKELGNFAAKVVGGASAGLLGGALTAFGAYGGATMLASASTGTAIASLSGAAATNATLAWFGGGSLAAGGLGMAGGAAVLGGLIAGPALMVMGLIVDAKADEKLNKALENKAQANEIIESLDVVIEKSIAIRRRSNMFYNLLSYLDSLFYPQILKMEEIINNEGIDYSQYSDESKKAIAQVASTAGSIKSILDKQLLTEDGSLSPESEEIETHINKLLYK